MVFHSLSRNFMEYFNKGRWSRYEWNFIIFEMNRIAVLKITVFKHESAFFEILKKIQTKKNEIVYGLASFEPKTCITSWRSIKHIVIHYYAKSWKKKNKVHCRSFYERKYVPQIVPLMREIALCRFKQVVFIHLQV